LIAVTAA